MTNPTEALAHDAEQRRQRILNQPAGPELDVLVAEQVFGWQPAHDALWRLPDGALASCLHIPPYSTEAGAAWLVVEAMHDDLGRFGVGCVNRDQWYVSGVVGVESRHRQWGPWPTMPEAICKAALLVKMGDRPR